MTDEKCRLQSSIKTMPTQITRQVVEWFTFPAGKTLISTKENKQYCGTSTLS